MSFYIFLQNLYNAFEDLLSSFFSKKKKLYNELDYVAFSFILFFLDFSPNTFFREYLKKLKIYYLTILFLLIAKTLRKVSNHLVVLIMIIKIFILRN
jgi:hypothetical protein